MNSGVRWVVGVGMAVAAWCVISIIPDHQAHLSDPIPVPARIGESVDISGMTVTVTDVHVTDGLKPAINPRLGGRWVVVDASVLAQDSDLGAPLGRAQLELNGTITTASDLIDSLARLDATQPRVGLVISGSILFQIPADAPLGEATLLLERRSAFSTGVWKDDQAQLVIDLSALPRESDLEIDNPTVAAP